MLGAQASRLRFVSAARTASGRARRHRPYAGALREPQAGGHGGFKLREILEVSGQDVSYLGSYLFYMGMLTLKGRETPDQTLELVVPNEVMRGLYVERMHQRLMPLGASRTVAHTILLAFLRSGDIEPLLDFIEDTLFPDFSNRDVRSANELTGQDPLPDPALEPWQLHHSFRTGARPPVCGPLPLAPARRTGVELLGPPL